MPHARPRIQITPTEETYHLILRLSKLTGKGQATIVRELLDEAAPGLQMMIDALQQIGKSPEQMMAAVSRMAAQAHQTIAQATLDLDNTQKAGRKPRVPGSKKPGAARSKGQGAAKT